MTLTLVGSSNADPFGALCPTCRGAKLRPGGGVCVRCAGTGKGPGAPPNNEEIRRALQQTIDLLTDTVALTRAAGCGDLDHYTRAYNLRAYCAVLLERIPERR